MIKALTIDPVAYAIFSHRLWAIGEEGRLTLQRVTASPIVAQGGECMRSFYDPEGRMVLAFSGHLRFAAATSDAIRKIVEWFAASPGIGDGDQIFFNDPYVAGSHTQDEMVIKPIYYGGELIAWTARSSHTADVGGVLAGEATKIYHEGIRALEGADDLRELVARDTAGCPDVSPQRPTVRQRAPSWRRGTGLPSQSMPATTVIQVAGRECLDLSETLEQRVLCNNVAPCYSISAESPV